MYRFIYEFIYYSLFDILKHIEEVIKYSSNDSSLRVGWPEYQALELSPIHIIPALLQLYART